MILKRINRIKTASMFSLVQTGPSHPDAVEDTMSYMKAMSRITADHSYAKSASKATSKQKVKPCCSGNRNILPAYKKSLTGKKVTQLKSVVTDTGKTLSLQVVNQRNRFGESWLHKAVLQGDIQMLKDILKLEPDVNMTDNAGWTALHEAAIHDEYEASLCLINAGALVNAVAQNGVTPLHDAVRAGHKRIAELLLKHGANPLLEDEDGETALGINTEPSLRVLMENIIPKDRPSAAPGNTREEISAGDQLISVVESGTQRVYITRQSQAAGSAQSLGGTAKTYKHGPSNALEHVHPNQPGRSEDSNSRRGTYNERVVPVKNVHRKNCFGQTLLHKAAREGNSQTVRQFLELGADVNMADNAGWTPLHEAALCGHYDVILDLIKAGALVNARACNGDTPLHDAIANGHVKIVNVLLRHGANPKLNDEGGQMTLTTAAEPFQQRLVEENMTQNIRKHLPALTYQDNVGEKTCDDTQLDTKATEFKLNTELQSDDTEMGQTSAPSQAAAVDMQEKQKKSSTSPHVKANSPPPPLPLTSSPLQQPSTPCHIHAPQLCSTPVYGSLFEDGTEEEDNDSDQTVDYLDGSSDESEDWALKPTQNFNLSPVNMEAHVEDTYMYTFPTEMV